MNLEQCIYSQDTVEDCLQTSFLDTNQLSLLSGIHTPAKYCESDQKMDGFQDCKCGKGTLDCSIHPSTPELWTAYMLDSLAQMFQQLEIKQELAQKHAAACIGKFSESLALFDLNSSTWKMSQQSFLTDSEQYSGTWPRSGILVSGRVYELPTVVPLMSETDGGDCFPTPTSHDAKKGAYPSEYNRNTPGIAVILGGKPSPMFQEWQMGWPINHTALKGSEMVKSHSKQQQPGESLEVRK